MTTPAAAALQPAAVPDLPAPGLPTPRPLPLIRRRLRNAVAAVDPVYLALLRILRPDHALKPDTELVIDGFPRSANTFLEASARHAWGRDLRIAQHVHAAAPLRAAARRGLPAMLPLRAPRPAVASLLLRDPQAFSARLALEEYVALHRGALPVLDRLLVVPFEAATRDFPAVAAALAGRFGPRWAPPTRSDADAVHALVDRLTADRVGRARVTYSPDRPEAERRARAERKARAVAALDAAIAADPALARLAAEAEALHARCLAAAPPALRRHAATPPAQAAAPVAVIGNLPPPVTGAAAITEAAARRAEARGPVLRLSLSPGAARGWRRHPQRTLGALRAAAGLLRLRRGGGRQVYVGCDGGAGRLYQIGLIALARALGMRVTLHHHSYTYLDRPDRTMRALLAAGGGALRHVFLSDGMARRFAEAYGTPAAALTLSNAAFLDRPAPTMRPPRPEGAPLRVGLLANLTAAKGLHEMIDLAREVARRGLPAEIRLAGPVHDPAERRALEAALAEPGLPLAWAGPLHGAAKADWYAGLDLFCLPTRHPDEAQPLVIFEAAFAGAPALAYARGAIAEQVDRPDALLAPDRPFAPWAAERIAVLAADPALLAARAEAARGIAEADAARGAETLSALFDPDPHRA